MNKEQEKIAVDIISILKSNDGFMTRQMLQNNIDGLDNHGFVVIRGLRDKNLIEEVGLNTVRLTEKGWDFESFKKLKINESINFSLAESNIKANKLNIKNAQWNRTVLLLNLIFAIINILTALILLL